MKNRIDFVNGYWMWPSNVGHNPSGDPFVNSVNDIAFYD